MTDINFAQIEKKWQEKWEKKKAFEVKEDSIENSDNYITSKSEFSNKTISKKGNLIKKIVYKKKKYYVLEQFPYPSGSGLHIGHAFIYTIGDVYARFKRMNGFNVLYPMGYDSLGLPAENAAIKNNTNPKDYTEKSIKYFSQQQKALGFSYDWSRVFSTHDPEYYKWDQWIFLKMLEKGLVYQKKSPVNYCRKCDTVLANEQVHNGKCWIHSDVQVEIKHLNQWYLRITDYAEELANFETIKEWPELIKKLQKNWIGKSYGTEIDFKINNENWPIFTTRPDTIYGVTFMVVSAQHPRLMELVTKEHKKDIENFVKKLSSVSQEDIDQLDKEGVFTGSYAINPINGYKVPVWAGNFVLADYGCGMVMAVPAHDERDFQFAKKYNIPIKVVINPDNFTLNSEKMSRAYVGDGRLVDSDEFNKWNNREAIDEITKYLEKKKLGKKTVNYKLRDWLISRQRYWGTPIPIVYCGKCGAVPVPEKNLPVLLPEKVKFGKGNPLETVESWINTKCPKCRGKARRETDTMDTFVNSSWYYLRYCDSKNKKKIFDSKKANYWVPIDMYIGGKEHACMHDIYIRFYTKFLRDIGLIKIDEPAVRLFVQGMVHGEDGNKMSKSIGNVIDPLVTLKKYSADSLRMFLVSVASPESDFNWSDNGIESMHKFVSKFAEFIPNIKIGKSSKKLESKLNKTIKEVTSDIENFKYNLAVIKIRQLFDVFYEEKESGKKELESLLKLISLFCPHIAEELWWKASSLDKSNENSKFADKSKGFISLSSWPVANEKKIDEKFEKEEQAFEKTVGDILNVLKIVEEKQGKEVEKIYLYAIPNEISGYDEEAISKRVQKQVKVFAVNDKNKHDPEGKASKAKPGKPGIFVE